MSRNENNLNAVVRTGIAYADAVRLRKDSMILRRWHELECGVGYGCVERDETTGKVAWRSSLTGRLSPFSDRETPTLKRIAAVMAKYPAFTSYIQGDPRGCALYILRPGDVPKGETADSYYSRGIAVY